MLVKETYILFALNDVVDHERTISVAEGHYEVVAGGRDLPSIHVRTVRNETEGEHYTDLMM